MVLSGGAGGARNNMGDLSNPTVSCDSPIRRAGEPQTNGHGGGLPMPVPVPVLPCTAAGLRPDQHVNLFTAGLVEGLRIDVEMQCPGNLEQL